MKQQQSKRKYFQSSSSGHNHGCDKQAERINALERDAKRIMQTVFYGNGKPSIQQQVQELSDWSKSMKQDIQVMKGLFYKLVWLVIATVIGAVLNLVLR